MNIYRGIRLADSVRLHKKDGSYYDQVKNGLDVFVEKLAEKGHELLSEFINDVTKVLIDFKCGHSSHWIKPNNYKNGQGCPKCGGKCPEQAKEDLLNMLKINGHQILGEYVDAKTKVLIDFNCGHPPHLTTPNKYKNGVRCSKCSGNNLEQAKEFLIESLKANGHELLSEYINCQTKILIDFKCGHKPHSISPNNYKNGKGCPKCFGNCQEQAKENFTLLVEQNGHNILSEYINNHSKILIDFKCNHNPHWIEPNNYKSGNRCPLCSESKGERKIREWLEINGFEFESNVEFDGLLGLNSGNLSYDFHIINLNILIEYQGKQHEQYVKGFHKNKNDFIKQQVHDKRKREFAEKNNIKLLEIWYWDFDNIEEILQNNISRS